MKFKGLINKLMLVGVLSSFVLLYSCGEDDPEEVSVAAPTITIGVTGTDITTNDDNTEISVGAGTDLVFNFTVAAPGGFNTFRTSGLATDLEFSRDDLGLDAGAVSATIPAITIPAGDMAGMTSFTVTAVDDIGTGQTSMATINITITSAPARVITATMLAAPTGDLASETFFSISRNETFSVNEVNATSEAISADLEMGYFFGANSNASLASIADYPSNILDLSSFGTMNSTSFVETTLTTLTETTTEADVAAILDGVDFTSMDDETISNLTEGQIIAFRSDTGSTGLIQVMSIVGTDGSDGRITLEFLLGADIQ